MSAGTRRTVDGVLADSTTWILVLLCVAFAALAGYAVVRLFRGAP